MVLQLKLQSNYPTERFITSYAGRFTKYSLRFMKKEEDIHEYTRNTHTKEGKQIKKQVYSSVLV